MVCLTSRHTTDIQRLISSLLQMLRERSAQQQKISSSSWRAKIVFQPLTSILKPYLQQRNDVVKALVNHRTNTVCKNQASPSHLICLLMGEYLRLQMTLRSIDLTDRVQRRASQMVHEFVVRPVTQRLKLLEEHFRRQTFPWWHDSGF